MSDLDSFTPETSHEERVTPDGSVSSTVNTSPETASGMESVTVKVDPGGVCDGILRESVAARDGIDIRKTNRIANDNILRCLFMGFHEIWGLNVLL